MNNVFLAIAIFIGLILSYSIGFSAYHHEGEKDTEKFLKVYPDKAGTKLNHCALCHCGGQYEKKTDKWVTLGSCQWCHYFYGYDRAGEIDNTMNPYGKDYKANGRNADAINAIENDDSDRDGFTNKEEIEASRFPGNTDDDPDRLAAPFHIYTRAQLEAMTQQHTQFILMNASRKDDNYVEYTGVPIETLLQNAGILDSATGITVYAPDGWANDHPMEEDEGNPEAYHVLGTYPAAVYYYDEQADIAINPVDGWCDYSAPSCQGRSHGEAITVSEGLKMILAYKRDDVYLDPGVLDDENKLVGEGPFRLVLPQKSPNSPDQISNAENQDVIWPYTEEWDHNADSSTRSVTIIKVRPLPEGTTDIDAYESGWELVDENKIIVYGAIDGNDSNGNGILDSEEGTDPASDFDGDGTPDFQDTDTARVRHSKGNDEKILFHTSKGSFVNVQALSDDDPEINQQNKPSLTFPYGVVKFKITGLTPGAGESVTVSLVFPDNVPKTASYYKITASGWKEIPFGSNNGDNTITLTLVDGDADIDIDGTNDGTIVDPGALATVIKTPSLTRTESYNSCFIATAAFGSHLEPQVKILREFRDRVLLTNFVGKVLVDLYYKCSPPVADFIARHSNLQRPMRLILSPLVCVSWVALNLGPGPTFACMILLIVIISVTSTILFIKGYSKKLMQ
ncbi:MAG: GEGP motif-containing diheme protein [Thermodesulfobacteriota bacterium]|nr:GEGP motif-containing diheme protein [Thermodesulfobacteriota bacterium]